MRRNVRKFDGYNKYVRSKQKSELTFISSPLYFLSFQTGRYLRNFPVSSRLWTRDCRRAGTLEASRAPLLEGDAARRRVLGSSGGWEGSSYGRRPAPWPANFVAYSDYKSVWKRPAATHARDTAVASKPTRGQMKRISLEPHDPARCVEPLDAPITTPVNPSTPQPSTTHEPAQFTPKTTQNQVGIGQRPSEDYPLGIANLLPEDLAGLITSTARNLNNPRGRGCTHHRSLHTSPHLLATTTPTSLSRMMRTTATQ